MSAVQQVDVAIVGAGPVGLCLARALADGGLSVSMLESQPLEALSAPAFDGREIALTHASRRNLELLGVWQRLPPQEISVLRDARVLNGPSPFSLDIRADDGKTDALGWLVPNHCIRKAAFEAVSESARVQVQAGVRIAGFERHAQAVQVRLENGAGVSARVLVAADSRFSQTRRAFGIGAQMHDVGRSMMVCRVRHEKAHQDVAWEWFGYGGQTLALLPLNADRHGARASVVLTLTPDEMKRVEALDGAALGREFERRFARRLGRMEVIGSRHVYPLVETYAERFIGPRLALLGDAAVGMHPVTAHGFNLGLIGQARLARLLREAAASGRDIGSVAVLQPYETGHRIDTKPLYLATRAIARLYTDERLPARIARDGMLRLAQLATPFRRLVAAHLAG